VVRIAPGIVIEMTPPKAQTHVEPATKAGLPPIVVVGAFGVHGPVTAGVHGIGVSTPRAAAVADATAGLLRLEHIANDPTFSIGTMSAIAAAGMPSIVTRAAGRTDRVAGATPKLHCSMAPAVTDAAPIRNLR
jgi:hypothetical protein